jgi:nitrogen-specific signal transduction histidine kinase
MIRELRAGVKFAGTEALGWRYAWLAALYLGSQASLIAICLIASDAADATRAYATGEALFSKAQKLAVSHLARFADTGEPKEYQRFQLEYSHALGARAARLALRRSDADIDRAVQGFESIGMQAGDSYRMSIAFRYFRSIPPVAEAIRIWEKADTLLLSLEQDAVRLKQARETGESGLALRAHLDHLEQIDEQLTVLEQAFGTKLVEVSELASWLLMAAVLTGAIVVSWIVVTMLLRPLAALERSEQRSRINEGRFRDFTEVGSDWFIELDSVLKVVSVSGHAPSMSEVGRQLILGRSWGDMITRYRVTTTPTNHLQLVQAHVEFREHMFVTKDRKGEESSWSISGRPVFDAGGSFGGYRITCKDISDLRRANRQLDRAREAAENASIAKSNFLANMSHELRTPLNAIIGFSEIIATEAVGPIGTPKYTEYATDINSSGQHLLQIISDILDLAKIESGTFQVDKSDVGVEEIIRCCQSICSGRASIAGVQVIYRWDRNVNSVLADALRLKQILINLVSNAIKFTPHGGRVHVSAERLGADLQIVVADSGEGMTKEQIEVALAPFGQATNDAHRRKQGTGLGLPITRSLVLLHGGEFDLSSSPGVGTTVKIRLPGACVDSDSGKALDRLRQAAL